MYYIVYICITAQQTNLSGFDVNISRCVRARVCCQFSDCKTLVVAYTTQTYSMKPYTQYDHFWLKTTKQKHKYL